MKMNYRTIIFRECIFLRGFSAGKKWIQQMILDTFHWEQDMTFTNLNLLNPKYLVIWLKKDIWNGSLNLRQ